MNSLDYSRSGRTNAGSREQVASAQGQGGSPPKYKYLTTVGAGPHLKLCKMLSQTVELHDSTLRPLISLQKASKCMFRTFTGCVWFRVQLFIFNSTGKLRRWLICKTWEFISGLTHKTPPGILATCEVLERVQSHGSQLVWRVSFLYICYCTFSC